MENCFVQIKAYLEKEPKRSPRNSNIVPIPNISAKVLLYLRPGFTKAPPEISLKPITINIWDQRFSTVILFSDYSDPQRILFEHKLHPLFIKKAKLKFMDSLKPKPPMPLGLHSSFQATLWIFRWLSESPHTKLMHFLSISLHTDLGTTTDCIA